jgi:hypothetical protein
MLKNEEESPSRASWPFTPQKKTGNFLFVRRAQFEWIGLAIATSEPA